MPKRPSHGRGPRLQRPLPRYELDIPAPPAPVQPESWLTALLPAILTVLLMTVVMGVVARATGMNASFLLLSIPMMVVGSLVTVITYFLQRRRTAQKTTDRVVVYGQLLHKLENQLHDERGVQQSVLAENDPSPEDCFEERLRIGGPELVEPHRHVWTRVAEDADFLTVRVGLGTQPSNVTVKAPQQSNVVEPDPLIEQAQTLATNYANLHDVPVTMPLPLARVVGIGGPRHKVVQAARAFVIQLATHHGPDVVKLVALYPAAEAAEWEWLRWLPHCWDEHRRVRFLADTPEAAHALLVGLEEAVLNSRSHQARDAQQPEGMRFSPAYVFLIADTELLGREPVLERLQREGPDLGAYPVFLESRVKAMPPDCRIVLRLNDGSAHLVYSRLPSPTGRHIVPVAPDLASLELADAYAREMARLEHRRALISDVPEAVSLLEMLGVRDVQALDVAGRWEQSRAGLRSVSAPVGLRKGGVPLVLDLHESKHGPNGLVAGTVGAGKSELLQTLIASLAIRYHPHRVAFILIDYKGSGMARPFTNLPHNLGTISDLDKGSLATRALTSLRIELDRRKRIFDDEKVAHIDEYQKLHREGRVATPLPHLIIIVDEFAEMKTEKPEVAGEFVRIARTGRSLGICLILAMQKPAGIVDGQVEANTRFRLCLRVASTEDSQAMLRRPEAAYLVGVGRAYLQVGANELFEMFQVAWSGATYDPHGRLDSAPNDIVEIGLDGSRRVLLHPVTVAPAAGKEIKQLDAVVAHLAETATQLRFPRLESLWLPPLPNSVALPDLPRSEGWDGTAWQPAPEWLAPVVGLLDDPEHKRQDPLRLELGRRGHLALYGAPGSGKTTFLETLITSLALSYSPADVQIYVLDFGGRTLSLFEGRVPHVGGVVMADETERVSRLLYYLRNELERRRTLFGPEGVTTLEAYRALPDKSEPAIVVMLDNYANFAATYADDDLTLNAIIQLVRDGSSYGLHVVLTTNELNSIRLNLTSNIGLRMTLSLTTIADYSEVVGRRVEVAPEPVQGRGLLGGERPLEYQAALPARGDTETARVIRLRELFAQMQGAWSGPPALPIRVLPELVSLDDIIQPNGAWYGSDVAAAPPTSVPLGLRNRDLKPALTDLADGPHFFIVGTNRSGKTTLLQTWLLALTARNTPGSLHIHVIDSLRGGLWALTQAIPAHLRGYAGDAASALELCRQLRAELEARRAAGDPRRRGRPAEPTQRPHIVLAIDDLGHKHNSAIATDSEDLELLKDLATLGQDLDFHMLVAAPLEADPAYRLRPFAAPQNGVQLGSTSDTFFPLQVPRAEWDKPLPVGIGFCLLRGRAERMRVATATLPAPVEVLPHG